MQRRAVLWIMGTFHTSLLWRVKAITGFISIHFYLNKLIEQHHLQIVLLSKQYAISTLIDIHHSKQAIPHCMAINHLTSKQSQKIKSSIVEINHYFNQVLLVFDNLNKELSPGFQLLNIFSDYSFFNTVKCKDVKEKAAHLNKLENIY